MSLRIKVVEGFVDEHNFINSWNDSPMVKYLEKEIGMKVHKICLEDGYITVNISAKYPHREY
jgi:hypothetical protein